MRILGVDYGRKRIGLALSDPLGMSAAPHGFILNNSKTLEQLKELIRDKEVSDIVIGLPISLKGTPTEMTREVEKFTEALRAAVEIPVHSWEERLSTAESERLLISAEVRRDKRKEVRDSIAASLILQGYLQSKGSRWTPDESS